VQRKGLFATRHTARRTGVKGHMGSGRAGPPRARGCVHHSKAPQCSTASPGTRDRRRPASRARSARWAPRLRAARRCQSPFAPKPPVAGEHSARADRPQHPPSVSPCDTVPCTKPSELLCSLTTPPLPQQLPWRLGLPSTASKLYCLTNRASRRSFSSWSFAVVSARRTFASCN
jgi:hypothetical protein